MYVMHTSLNYQDISRGAKMFSYPIVEIFEQQAVVQLSFYCVLWYHPVCVVLFFSFNVKSSSPALVHSGTILRVVFL